MDRKFTATVVRATGSWYDVLHDGETVRCRIRGRLRLKGVRSTNPVVVGDEVACEADEGGDYVIADILPRRNYVIRRASNLSKESHIIAANVDQALLMASLRSPETPTEFVDRFLVTCEAYKVPVTILLSKLDLQDAEAVAEFRAVYEGAGYRVLEVSVREGRGVEEVRELLAGRTTLVSGNSGVGKSTLMNALVGEKLSIITSKAQTTRHRILGIVNGDDFQIVFSDTPGILKPCYKLQESMMNFVRGALSDADVLLYVTDTVERDDERAAEIIDRIRQSGVPTLVVVNKIDLTTQEALEALVEKWRATLPDAEIIPISAREGFNIAGLFDRILALLPEGEPFYPKDTLTDKTLRFFASEIIREKILRNYDKEIPYSCEIEIEEYREEPGIDRISAVIYVARNSQKGILIGHKGEKLKKVGRQAREELEEFLRKKVFLQLFVKVSEDWRNDQRQLRRFGYDPQ